MKKLLISLIIIAIVAFSGFWLYSASNIKQNLQADIEELQEISGNSLKIEYAGIKTGGFPLKYHTKVKQPLVQYDAESFSLGFKISDSIGAIVPITGAYAESQIEGDMEIFANIGGDLGGKQLGIISKAEQPTKYKVSFRNHNLASLSWDDIIENPKILLDVGSVEYESAGGAIYNRKGDSETGDVIASSKGGFLKFNIEESAGKNGEEVKISLETEDKGSEIGSGYADIAKDIREVVGAIAGVNANSRALRGFDILAFYDSIVQEMALAKLAGKTSGVLDASLILPKSIFSSLGGLDNVNPADISSVMSFASVMQEQGLQLKFNIDELNSKSNLAEKDFKMNLDIDVGLSQDSQKMDLFLQSKSLSSPVLHNALKQIILDASASSSEKTTLKDLLLNSGRDGVIKLQNIMQELSTSFGLAGIMNILGHYFGDDMVNIVPKNHLLGEGKLTIDSDFNISKQKGGSANISEISYKNDKFAIKIYGSGSVDIDSSTGIPSPKFSVKIEFCNYKDMLDIMHNYFDGVLEVFDIYAIDGKKVKEAEGGYSADYNLISKQQFAKLFKDTGLLIEKIADDGSAVSSKDVVITIKFDSDSPIPSIGSMNMFEFLMAVQQTYAPYKDIGVNFD